MGRRIVIHNHLPARDEAPAQAVGAQAKRPAKVEEKSAKQIQAEAHRFYDSRDEEDTWYHSGQVNGYYILEGAVGDKGRWIVRNGKYDIVKNAGSKSEAVSFAKSQKHGGIKEPEAIAADRRI